MPKGSSLLGFRNVLTLNFQLQESLNFMTRVHQKRENSLITRQPAEDTKVRILIFYLFPEDNTMLNKRIRLDACAKNTKCHILQNVK